MPLLRTRIVPQTDSRSFVWLGVASGAVWLVVLTGAMKASIELMDWLVGYPWWFWSHNATMLLLTMVPIGFVLRVTQRLRSVAGFAGAYFATLIGLGAGLERLSRVDGGAIVGEWLDLELLIVPLAWVVLVLGALGLLGVARWVVRRIEEHGPEDCPTCGYTYGDSVRVCAECGTDRASGAYEIRRTLACARLFQRWSRAVVLLAAVIVGVYVSIIGVTRTIPTLRMMRAIAHESAYTTYTHEVMRLDDTYEAGNGVIVWQPESEGSNRSVSVWFKPSGEGKIPMAVWVSAKMPGRDVWGHDSGHDFVIAGFNPEQMRWVHERGLPDGLARALFKKADEIGWAPGVAPGEGRVYPISASDFFKE